MRINLMGHNKKGDQRQPRVSGRRRQRRGRTFRSSLVQPETPLRRRPEPPPAVPVRRASGSQQRGPAAVNVEAPATRRPRAWRLAVLRLVSGLALVCLLGAIVYISTAATFFVYDPEIVGNRYVQRDAIRGAAAIDEMNIFWIRPRLVADRIREVQGIRDVRVRCSLPARVLIEVAERKPVVLLRAEAQRQDFWLDEEGVVLPYPGEPTETVFVLDTRDHNLEVGERLEPPGLVQSALQLSASVPMVRLVYYRAGRGLSFTQQTSIGEWPVYVGDSTDLPRKIQVLQALTDYLVAHKIRPSYVDVRWADWPVYGKPGSRVTSGD